MYYTQATYYHHNLLEYMYDMDHRHLTPLLQGALKNMKEILPAAPPPAASPWQRERVPGFTAGGDVSVALPSDQTGSP